MGLDYMRQEPTFPESLLPFGQFRAMSGLV